MSREVSVALMQAPFRAPVYMIDEKVHSVSVAFPVMRRRGDVVADDGPVNERC